ncbi:MAG TPA: serine hydrolase domain-containing protein [Pirellulales bacterium]|jgi:CubicO group peptidase (beta-lactamase class C family)|nr:serine hydrolase domain-containing protein [Pirellulales bacterium]
MSVASGGFSNARLERLHDTMAGYVERGEVPGLALLLNRHGETHVDVLGTLAIGGSEAVRRDTIFRIASMTKPVVAAAALVLVEECKLRLDEPVDRLLPELAQRQVLRRIDGPLDETEPAHRSITLRDLLTFRMGFGIVMVPPGTYPIQQAAARQRIRLGPPLPQDHPAPDEWLRGLGTLPWMYQPGERWLYDTASDVLGVLIARAAGQPLDAFLRERLFEPLGMVDTDFHVPADKIERLATSYRVAFKTGSLVLYDEARGGHWSRPPAFPSGGGGLVSTVDDYLAFGRMLLNMGRHGDVRILSRPSVEAMTTDQLTPAQKANSGLAAGYFDAHGWGFGVSIVTQRAAIAGAVGQYGWDGGLGTSWRTDPREDLIGILLTQRAWSSPVPPDVCQDFWNSAYQAIDD